MQISIAKSPHFKLLFLLLLLLAVQAPAQDSHTADPSCKNEDSFRWLEDSEDPRTQEWLNNQQSLFEGYIKSNNYRTSIKESLKGLLDYEAYTIPTRCAGRYFFKMRLPGENQHVLYVQEGIQGTPCILLDPNKLSTGPPVSLTGFAPSPDGKLLAYGLSESGSDWTIWRVLDVFSGKSLSDHLENIKFFPVVWTPDCRGFFYSRLDSDEFCRVYFHALGTPQESDILIYGGFKSPEYFSAPSISSDQKLLLINIMTGSSGPNAILYRPLDKPQEPFLTLLPMKEGNHSYLCNDGPTFYCWTNEGADLGKVISLNSQNGVQQDVIPEGRHSLDQVISIGRYFLARFSDNVISRLMLYDRHGREIRKVALPSMGTVALADTAPSSDQDEDVFFSFTHFVQPPLIYHYQLDLDQLNVFKQPQLTFSPHDYQTSQVFFSSKDGTQVPLFIVHKKGLELNGKHKTLLYAYGGFGHSLNPYYNTLHMAWLESGGIFALANIRGGAEYGKKWHEEGKREKKQNCFDDFISAAEWLISRGYTNSSKLAIRGASNGGLLTAVSLNKRPDLFGAALVEVGVLDMLRFHLFTVGRFWMVEYGNPEDPQDHQFLCRYSPYHNVRKGASYPSVMITTGDHDDRVVPLHSYKYAAAMQGALAGKNRVLLRVDRNGGHGAGKSVSQWVDEAADILAFLKSELADQSE